MVRCELLSQRLGEGIDRALREAVDRLHGGTDHAPDGAHVEDAALGGTQHIRNHRAGQTKHVLYVGCEHLLELVIRDVLGEVEGRDTGVVYEEEGILRGLDPRAACIGILRSARRERIALLFAGSTWRSLRPFEIFFCKDRNGFRTRCTEQCGQHLIGDRPVHGMHLRHAAELLRLLLQKLEAGAAVQNEPPAILGQCLCHCSPHAAGGTCNNRCFHGFPFLIVTDVFIHEYVEPL